MTDIPTLPAPWHTAREVRTEGELFIPDGVRAVVRAKWNGEFTVVRIGPNTVGCDFDAFVPLTKAGAGALVERTPIVTREWETKPPNDETRIVISTNDLVGLATIDGRHAQKPGTAAIAWALLSEVLPMLTGPRTVHVPVTTEDSESSSGDGGKA